MTDRPTKVDYFLSVARAVASRGDCRRATVGCVLVDADQHIVATGYNGTFAPGQRGCFEGGCFRGKRITENAAEVELAALDCQTRHAEANAVIHLIAGQVPCVAFVTRRPCADCRTWLTKAGVRAIVYLTPDDGVRYFIPAPSSHDQTGDIISWLY